MLEFRIREGFLRHHFRRETVLICVNDMKGALGGNAVSVKVFVDLRNPPSSNVISIIKTAIRIRQSFSVSGNQAAEQTLVNSSLWIVTPKA